VCLISHGTEAYHRILTGFVIYANSSTSRQKAGSIVFFAAYRKLVHLQGLSCDLVDRPLRSKKCDPLNQTN